MRLPKFQTYMWVVQCINLSKVSPVPPNLAPPSSSRVQRCEQKSDLQDGGDGGGADGQGLGDQHLQH